MKAWRSLQGRVRVLLSRTEHSGARVEGGYGTPAGTSATGVEQMPRQPTSVFHQYRGHSTRYGPHAPYRLPLTLKEGVLLLSGGAIGWFASRTSAAAFDQLGLELTTLKDNYMKGLPSWPFGLDPPLGPNFLADAAAKAAPAVVNINTSCPEDSQREGRSQKICGSGFITDPSGVIMTNAHVVEAALEQWQAAGNNPKSAPLRIALQDGRVLEGSVLSIDRLSDLALVKVETTEALPSVRMGSSAGMRVGEWVLALGSPLTLQNSVTAGIVSCIGRKAKELGLSGSTADFIQTDAAINTGNSGGPLVNMAGEVVGISCMRALHSNGVSFAIPIDTARRIMEQLLDQGRVLRPYIGIQMLQLNAQNAAQLQRRDRRFPALSAGILVPSVHPGSPAAKAGLLQGDIITGFGGAAEAELSTAALIAALTRSIGRPLALDVRRGEEQLKLSIMACEARTG